MNNFKNLIKITAFFISLLTITPLYAATAEPLDLEADMLAKLARIRAQGVAAGGASNVSKSKKNNESTECGSLEVGNVDTERAGFKPTEVNVIITGDVINANNNCE